MKHENSTIPMIGIFHDLKAKIRKYLEEQIKSQQQVKFRFYPRLYSKTNITSEMKSCVQQAEVLLGYYFPNKLLKQAQQLNLLISPYAGVVPLVNVLRQLKVQYERFTKVIVVNSHGNAKFVAQHVLSLLFAVSNQIVHHHNRMNQGIWQFKQENQETYPLFEKTIGLLGYGEINQRVHQYLQGMPVKFGGLRTHWPSDEKYPTPLEKFHPGELDEFLKITDVMIVAVPYTEKTHNMISRPELEKLGKTSILINVARGTIVNEKALYTALYEQEIRGAGIDVWYDYSPEPDAKGRKFPYSQPFHKLNNIVMSPHRADSPFHERTRWDNVIQNICKYLRGEENYHNQIDIDRGY